MNRLRGKFTSCKITRREDLTVDLFKIWLKPLEPFSFKPGQYCTIGVDGLERPYSIVSSPDEEEKSFSRSNSPRSPATPTSLNFLSL